MHRKAGKAPSRYRASVNSSVTGSPHRHLPALAAGLLLTLTGIFSGVRIERQTLLDHRMRFRIHDNVTEVSPQSLDPAHDAHPVYLVGTTATSGMLEDPVFQARYNAIHLRRVVERYQWQESLMAMGESSYYLGWFPRRIDSSTFASPEGHENPEEAIPYGPWNATAHEVTLGSYQLSHPLIQQMDTYERTLPEPITPPPGWQIVGNTLVKSQTPENPVLGDLRVYFEHVPNQQVSILARQEGMQLQPLFKLPEEMRFVQSGEQSLTAMLPPVPPGTPLQDTLRRLVALIPTLIGLMFILNSLGARAQARWQSASTAPSGVFIVLTALLVHATLVGVVWLSRSPGLSLLLLGLGASGLFSLTLPLLTAGRNTGPNNP